MPSGSRGRPLKTMNLYHLSSLAGEVAGIMRGGLANPHIINSKVGSVTVTIYVSVKNYHRNAPLVSFGYDRRYGISLIGRGNDYIKIIIHEVADIGNLFFIVIIRTSDLHLSIGVEHCLPLDLIVHFCPPVIPATL